MSDSEKTDIKALFAAYETADAAVTDARLELENAIIRRSTTIEAIADATGKEGTKQWKGLDGRTKIGRICKRGDTWFFKGGKVEAQDFT